MKQNLEQKRIARRLAARAMALTSRRGDPGSECSKDFRDMCIAMAMAGLEAGLRRG